LISHPDKKSLTCDKPGQTSLKQIVIFGGLAVVVTFQ
jgi:hypothetical protein